MFYNLFIPLWWQVFELLSRIIKSHDNLYHLSPKFDIIWLCSNLFMAISKCNFNYKDPVYITNNKISIKSWTVFKHLITSRKNCSPYKIEAASKLEQFQSLLLYPGLLETDPFPTEYKNKTSQYTESSKCQRFLSYLKLWN